MVIFSFIYLLLIFHFVGPLRLIKWEEWGYLWSLLSLFTYVNLYKASLFIGKTVLLPILWKSKPTQVRESKMSITLDYIYFCFVFNILAWLEDQIWEVQCLSGYYLTHAGK